MSIKLPFSDIFIVITQTNLYKILCTEKVGSKMSLGNVFTLIQVIFNLSNNCSVIWYIYWLLKCMQTQFWVAGMQQLKNNFCFHGAYIPVFFLYIIFNLPLFLFYSWLSLILLIFNLLSSCLPNRVDSGS